MLSSIADSPLPTIVWSLVLDCGYLCQHAKRSQLPQSKSVALYAAKKHNLLNQMVPSIYRVTTWCFCFSQSLSYSVLMWN